MSLMEEAAALEATTQKNPVTPGEVLPAAELLGDMLVEIGRYEAALEAYRDVLDRSRNRFNALHGAGLAAERMGDREAAEGYYSRLLEITGSAATRDDVIQRVRVYLDQA